MEQLASFLKRFQTEPAADAYRYLGCHKLEGGSGYVFRVWAPHAAAVHVVGDFNFWNAEDLPMRKLDGGVWEAVSAYAKEGQAYKYCVQGRSGRTVYKTDPYGNRCCALPETSSIIDPPDGFCWHDGAYRARMAKQSAIRRPVNIYEVHTGSWKRHDDGSYLSYEELAAELVPYVKDMGYTHIELLPIMEYPYDPSWGYQVTCYFAPTHRYGTPKQLMQLVDACHQAGIGVILDWVPAHFPKDENGLFEFDGECCYELSDPMMNEHPDWTTRIYDYGKPEVQSFLISNACYWLSYFHVDGIRVDAVASMLYLDYDRQGGAWTPNKYGGHENLEAIDFLRELNAMAFQTDPAVLMIAEESTAWPLVTRPPDVGGLGFNLKWNMGWMNDMCHYLKLDPFFRQYNHKDITFSMMYAFSENFVLPISHDEVVHMKGSVVGKMPGDYENQLRCLKGFYAYLLAHPGKKLLFMGAEIGQWHEWDSDGQLDWYLLDQPLNRKIHRFFRDINAFYKKTAALWEIDFDWGGFEWLVPDDNHNNVVVFLRKDRKGRDLMCAVNFSPNTYENYRMGVPPHRRYVPVFNTDDPAYGGGGFGDTAPVTVEAVPSHGKEHSAAIRIPAFGAVFLRGEGAFPKSRKKQQAKELEKK